MNKRGFRNGVGYRQSPQYKRQYDDYDSDQELRREPRMRMAPQYRNMSGGRSFMDNEFPLSSRRDGLDSGFDNLTRLSGSNPSVFRSGSNRGLDSSSSFSGLGSSVSGSDLVGGRASTQWLEEQLRMRETQLAMTSSLLKEQTQLLSQVGSVLERTSSPLKREPPSVPRNQSDFFPKRFRPSPMSGGSNRGTNRSPGFRGGMRGRGYANSNRGGQMRGGGGQQHRGGYQYNRVFRPQNQKPVMQTNVAAGKVQVQTKTAANKVQTKKRPFARKYKPEYTKPEDIPEHDGNKPVGDRYIVSVQGYYCRLCNKFYQNENSARVMHASQLAHYEKWKATVLQSIHDRNRNASGTKTSKKDAKESNGTKEEEKPVEEPMEVKTAEHEDGNKTEEEMTVDATENSNEDATQNSNVGAAEISNVDAANGAPEMENESQS